MTTNFSIALRHLWKNKLFSFINIIGLSLGLASCFIILLHVKFETGFDKFHQKKDRIVRVMNNNYSYTPIVMATVMPEYFPEIEKILRIGKLDWTKCYVVKDRSIVEEHHFLYSDSTFFSIFSFPLLSGDLKTVLRSPDRIMLSESTARKYFGAHNPLGQTISMRIMSNTRTLTIEGVFKDFPEQSHFHANFMVSLEFIRKDFGEQMFTSWGANSVHTYLLLKQPGMSASMADRMRGFIDNNVPDDLPKNFQYGLQALTQIHLYSHKTDADIEVQGSIIRVIIFASIALLVLIIAVANFILLSLSLSYQRIREFGIRKIVGARQRELVSLVSAEFLIVFILAVQISLMLVELSIPWFESRLNFMVYRGIFANAGILALFLAVVFFLGYMASLYITMNVSRIKPIEALRNALPMQHGWIPTRGVLVVFQFSIMIGLLVCLMIMQKQLRLIRHKDLGFRKEQLISVNIPSNPGKNYQLLRDEIKKVPGVISASGANYIPPTQQWWISGVKKPGDDEEYMIEEINGDYDLVETLGLEMVQGRTFSRDFASDSNAIIINEAAALMMDIKNPLESYLIRGEGEPILSHKTIIGVFKDFHIRSLYEEIKPMAFFLAPSIIQQMAIRLAPGDNRNTLKEIGRRWNSVFPEDPIEYTYIDEALHLSYLRDDQAHALISLFTFLSLMIALMGLFGLSAFTVERRTKETGIRKVNGATPADILFVLSRQFTYWIMISFTIALPASWFAMHKWLQHFAYRTEISWWIFPFALLISLSIACITIAWQTYRAATRNPVEALRYE